MSRPSAQVLLHHIQRLLVRQADAERSDGELLHRFLDQGDEAAFTALVQRHGALVWQVCTAALPSREDAEDVFQATFLVLARRASAIRKRDSLACWLHGVAFRLAQKVRAQNLRRHAQSSEALDQLPARSVDDLTLRELRQVLHEELNRLPEKHRLPILLCHLEGRTQDEAARALGWTLGQLRGRLLRGRELLHQRLTRRGLAPSVPLLAAALSQGNLGAAPLMPLTGPLCQKIMSALQSGAGSAEVLTTSLRLADGFVREAVFFNSKRILAFTLSLLFLAGILGLAALDSTAQSEPQAQQETIIDDNIFPAKEQANEEQPLLKDLLGDPLPPDALLRLGTLRFRHGGPVRTLFFSADGETLLCGGWDSYIRRWAVATGEELQPIAQPKNLSDLSLAGEGKIMVGSERDKIYIWDLATGKKVKEIDVPGIDLILLLSLSPDERLVALAGKDNLVRLWDLAAEKEIRTFKRLPDKIEPNRIIFSPDSKLLALRASDGVSRIHDVETGNELVSFRPKQWGYHSLGSFSPDGKTLLAAEKNNVLLWEIPSGKLLRRIDGLEGHINTVRYCPNGKLFAAGTSSGTIMLWEAATAKKLHEIKGHAENVVTLAFSADSKMLASGGFETCVRLWDTETGKQLNSLSGHQERIAAVAVSPDEQLVATASWDNSMRFWDAGTGKELRRLDWPKIEQFPFGAASLRAMTFSPDGKLLAAIKHYHEHKVVFWNVSTGKPVQTFPGSSAAFSPDGKTLATAGPDRTIRLFELASGKEIRQFQGDFSGIYRLVFTPDGKTLVLASYGTVIGISDKGELRDKNTIWLWDLASGKPRLQFGDVNLHFGDAKVPTVLAISPDGRMLITGTLTANTIRLWELATGQERAELPGHEEKIFAAAFLPDGKHLASGSEDNTIRLWQLPSGKQVHSFKGHRSWVHALAIFPNGKKLVSGSRDTTGLVWKIPPALFDAKPQPIKLKPAELTQLWDDLAGDANKAYQAIGKLAAAPQQAVPFLANQLQPVAAPGAQQVAQWIADLDSKNFATREKATAALEKASEFALPQLRAALEKPASLEATLRLQKLLETAEGQIPPPQTLRQIRAVEVLEYIASAEAQAVLKTLAQGATAARQTQEAQAALHRLEKQAAGEQ